MSLDDVVFAPAALQALPPWPRTSLQAALCPFVCSYQLEMSACAGMQPIRLNPHPWQSLLLALKSDFLLHGEPHDELYCEFISIKS